MDNPGKEIFKVKYEVVTPIHVGNGLKIPKTELAFYPDEGLIRKVDFEKFVESLPTNKIRQMSEKLRFAQNKFFNEILSSEKLTPEQIPSEYKLIFKYDYRIDNIRKLREISAHIKTPFFKPYIPGSTIKGWLRTALLYYYLKRIKEAKGYIEEFNDKLDSLPRNVRRLRYEKVNIAKIIEDKIFGANPREDILRFLIITDTSVESSEQLCLGLIQIFHPVYSNQNIQFLPLKFSQYLELLDIKAEFIGKIVFSKDLKLFKETFLQSKSLPVKIKNFIINDFLAIPREECAEKLCKISNFLSKNIIEYNYEYLERLNQEIESERLENLIEYYNNELFPLYDKVAESNNEFLLRLGAGTDWHSKTIGLEVMDYFLKNKRLSFNDFYDRINRLQLFKGSLMHKHFKLMSISRKYIVDESKNPHFPLGWVKAKLIN